METCFMDLKAEFLITGLRSKRFSIISFYINFSDNTRFSIYKVTSKKIVYETLLGVP